MSELADSGRLQKRSWAAPGGAHDFFVRFLKLVLPALIGVLMAYLALSPLTKSREISFILDKSKVEVAKERMRVQSAQYRGQDNLGRAFILTADGKRQDWQVSKPHLRRRRQHLQMQEQTLVIHTLPALLMV